MARTSRGNLRTAEGLHSVAIRLLRLVREEDPRLGQSPARLSALSVLVFGGPCTPSELARREQVSRPTMTRLLQGLRSARLVVLRRDPRDGRRVLVEPSARGRALLLLGRARRVRLLARLFAGTSGGQRAALAKSVTVLETLLAREERRRAEASPRTASARHLPGVRRSR